MAERDDGRPMDPADRAAAAAVLRQALPSLPDDALSRLVGSGRSIDLPAGHEVFRKGAPSDGVYIVVAGRVSIVDEIRGAEREIALVDPGDFLGEVSVAAGAVRTRAARTRTDTRLVVLPVGAFSEAEAAHPGTLAELLDAFADRMAGREEAAAEAREE
jgi:CRP-like cAMP-binding protein